jgi:hypothetical protein
MITNMKTINRMQTISWYEHEGRVMKTKTKTKTKMMTRLEHEECAVVELVPL